jgi:hypothetical protein
VATITIKGIVRNGVFCADSVEIIYQEPMERELAVRELATSEDRSQ